MSVSMRLVLEKASSVDGYSQTLSSFVENQMAAFLKSMREIQYHSAIQHLKDGKRTPGKRKEYVLLAIGDLENAYRAFEASAPKGLQRFLKEHLLSCIFEGHKERSKAYERACATVLLQSMCYTYVGDSANSKVSLKKARDFFERYVEAEKRAFVKKHTTVVPGLPRYSATKRYPPSETLIKEFDERINGYRKKLEALAHK